MENIQLLQVAFDAFDSQIALLERTGKIIAFNQAWKDNSTKNFLSENTNVGDNYLKICRTIVGSESKLAREIATEIEAIARSPKTQFKINYNSQRYGRENRLVIHIRQVKQDDWL